MGESSDSSGHTDGSSAIVPTRPDDGSADAIREKMLSSLQADINTSRPLSDAAQQPIVIGRDPSIQAEPSSQDSPVARQTPPMPNEVPVAPVTPHAEDSQDTDRSALTSASDGTGEQSSAGNGHSTTPNQPLLAELPTLDAPSQTPDAAAREPTVVGAGPPIVPGTPSEPPLIDTLKSHAPGEPPAAPPSVVETTGAIEVAPSGAPPPGSSEPPGVSQAEASASAPPSTPEPLAAPLPPGAEVTAADKATPGVPEPSLPIGSAPDPGKPAARPAIVLALARIVATLAALRTWVSHPAAWLRTPFFWGALAVVLVVVILVVVGSVALAKQLAPKPQPSTSDLYRFAVILQESTRQEEGGVNCRGTKFLLPNKTTNGEGSASAWLRICDLTLDLPFKAGSTLTGYLFQRLETVVGPQWSKQQLTPPEELEVGAQRLPGVGMHLRQPGTPASPSSYWYEIITQNGKRLYAIEVSCAMDAWDSCWGTFRKMIDSLEFRGSGM